MTAKKLHVVRLTPSGRGGIASLLLSGPGAMDVFAGHWTGPAPTAAPGFGRFRLGNELYEELVVHRAGPDELELHCHGGEAVVAAIEAVLVHAGAESARWTDFFFPPDAACRQEELALKLLPFAPTERTALILLDQSGGALARETAGIETLTDPVERRRRLDRLAENARLGRHLVRPFRVVLAGGANAGKSTLLNAILGFQRAIVDAAPGTTRDVVSGRAALDGFPVDFYDTAGFRDIAEPEDRFGLEREGIERARLALDEADLVVWLVDLTVPASERPEMPDLPNLLVCGNKVDVAATPDKLLPLSAATGVGVERLLEVVARRLVPRPPEPLEAVPLSEHDV